MFKTVPIAHVDLFSEEARYVDNRLVMIPLSDCQYHDQYHWLKTWDDLDRLN